MTDLSHAALVLIGHGSTVNPDSSAPTRLQAGVLGRRGIFAEVKCAFWKELPSLKTILSEITSDEIYIVPNFISEGYFTQTVIPREMNLLGKFTHRDGKSIHYCAPVGTHPKMTQVLLHRAREIAPGAPPQQTSLFIVGHGTPRDANSSFAARDQSEKIAALGEYAEVLPAYMEEPPFIADWHKASTQPNVIVVPFFISDGLHSYQDIPVLLGIETEPGPAASRRPVFRNNPYQIHGKTLYYAGAIGNDPLMAGIIIDQCGKPCVEPAQT